MGLLYTSCAIVLFWLIIYAINTFLLECKFTSAFYAKILSKNGLSINTLHIKWYTVKCNRLFMKISNWRPNFFKWWFNMGVLFGILGQVGSIVLLIYTLVDFFRSKPVTQQILVPVLPGVNVPTNQTLYYFIALFICGLFHELGHAVAASREQVRVNGFGVFLMFIFPGAYVDLCSDHLLVISPIRQLRIFCAGVWHNFILVLFALGCLQLHPYFISALFDRKVHVSNILKDSPLESKIKLNSFITSVGNCNVMSSLDYYECLYRIQTQPSSIGYCMNMNVLATMTSSPIKHRIEECCGENDTMSNYCFSWGGWSNGGTNLTQSSQINMNYACLPARPVTEKQPCNENHWCTDGEVCLTPASLDNSTRLIKIQLAESTQSILYLGSVDELIYTISIEDFIPKSKFIPKFLNFKLQLILKYLVAFSGAIGLLNLVPCFALDGQYILASILSINKRRDFVTTNEAQRPFIYVIMMLVGTTLLLLNILLSFASLAYSKLANYFPT